MNLRLLLFLLLPLLAACRKDLDAPPPALSDVPANSRGTNYFVSSSTGSDSNNGTSSMTPWQSITKLNHFNLQSGDIVYFKGGDTWGSGGTGVTLTAKNGVSYTTYGIGRANLYAPPNGDGIQATNVSYTIIEHISVNAGISGNPLYSALGGTPLNAGIRFNHTTSSINGYNFISDCRAEGFREAGIIFEANSTGGWSNCTIQNSEVFNNGLSGIYIRGLWLNDSNYMRLNNRNMLIDECYAHDNPGMSGYTQNWSGSGIFMAGCRDSRITQSWAKNNAANSYGGAVGIWMAEVDRCTIDQCESMTTHNGTVNVDGDGFDMDGGTHNSIIEYCYSHDNEGAGYLVYEWGSAAGLSNNTIRYCISENDGTFTHSNGLNIGVIHVGGQSGNSAGALEVYNNTFYLADGVQAYRLENNNISGHVFRNNIVYAAGTSEPIIHLPTNNVTLNNNCYYSPSSGISWFYGSTTYTSFSSYQSGSGQDAAGINADPLFAGTPGGVGEIGYGQFITYVSALQVYELGADSPCINAGQTVGSPSGDFWGDGMTTFREIGVDEYY